MNVGRARLPQRLYKRGAFTICRDFPLDGLAAEVRESMQGGIEDAGVDAVAISFEQTGALPWVGETVG